MARKLSPFAGIFPNDSRDTIRGRDSNAARRYWRGLDQIDWELKRILIEAGWFAGLPASFKQLTIDLRYTAQHGVVAADSAWQGKNSYTVCVEANGVGLAEGPTDEERYWPLKRSCVQALIHATEAMGGSPKVLQALGEALAQIPPAPPWPALPPFSLELSAGFRDPVDPRSAAAHSTSPTATTGIRFPLPEEAGVLWLTVAIPGDFSTESEDRLVDAIKDYMQRSRLGDWDGDSRGGRILDLSFEVANLRRAAEGLESFIAGNFAGLEFRISDEYEPALDGDNGADRAGAAPVKATGG